MNRQQQGYTIIELVVVMAVGLILANLIIFYAFNFWRAGALLETDQDTLITRLNAGDYIRDHIGESTGLIIQNSIPDPHALATDPVNTDNTFWIPLHAVSPRNVSVGAANTFTPLLYFRSFSQNSSKALIMNGQTPYEDEFVLYLNGTTKQLLARTIANPNANNNRLKTTCPPEIATSNCPSDRVIANDVASIDTRYFSRNGSQLNYQSSVDVNSGEYNGPDFPLVEVLELNINLAKEAAFERSNSSINSTIIRIAIRNG